MKSILNIGDDLIYITSDVDFFKMKLTEISGYVGVYFLHESGELQKIREIYGDNRYIREVEIEVNRMKMLGEI